MNEKQLKRARELSLTHFGSVLIRYEVKELLPLLLDEIDRLKDEVEELKLEIKEIESYYE